MAKNTNAKALTGHSSTNSKEGKLPNKSGISKKTKETMSKNKTKAPPKLKSSAVSQKLSMNSSSSLPVAHWSEYLSQLRS